jgi:hypothetical protein
MTAYTAETYLKQIAAMPAGRDLWKGGPRNESHYDFVHDIQRIDDAYTALGGIRRTCLDAAFAAAGGDYSGYAYDSPATRIAVFAAVQGVVKEWLRKEVAA